MSKRGVEEVVHKPHVRVLATRYMLLSFPIKHISVLGKDVQKQRGHTLKSAELWGPNETVLLERQGIGITLRVGYVAQGDWLVEP